MKLQIEPRKRRSWDCVITDGSGARVATTSRATSAELCGLVPRKDGSIAMGNGAPAAVLRVEARSKRWVLVDAGGQQRATARASGRKVYVTFAGPEGTVRWAPAGGWHRHLEALRQEGKGGKKLSRQPLGTFKRTSGSRCRCTAEFDDAALSVEAQLFLTWLGVQLLHDARRKAVHEAIESGVEIEY